MIGKTNINGANDASGVGALLSITAPIGSVVTVSKGNFSKILRNYININLFQSRCFYLVTSNKLGTWTVSCTDGTTTISKSVSVSSIGQVSNVILNSSIYLYNLGDECIDRTGGWLATSIDTNYTNRGTVTKNTNNINIINTNGGSEGIKTINMINFSGYSTLEVTWYRASNASDIAGMLVAEVFPCTSSTSSAIVKGQVTTLIPSTDPNNPTITNLDVTGLNDFYRVGINGPLGGVFVQKMRLIT